MDDPQDIPEPSADIKSSVVQSYRHAEKRTNIPPAGLSAQGRIEQRPKVLFSHDPHLPPELRFDETGRADDLLPLLEKARHNNLADDEFEILANALKSHQPWLEWAGKREQYGFVVDPVAIHIHERVAAEAILATAKRQDIQRSLFADPEFAYHEAVKFYAHSMDWTNRLILGDSLTVMGSLALRENLAGKVQMIYVDPPYGIRFASNFQPFVRNRDVRDREQDLTREMETVKAYRDTWTLGVHSYLSYLRDRLTIARHLLDDSGSIFVQIGDDNVHLVHGVLDEVFGAENSIRQIVFRTTASRGGDYLDSISNYLLWFAKDRTKLKYNQLMLPRSLETESNYDWIERDGEIQELDEVRRWTPQSVLKGRKYALSDLTSQGYTSSGDYPLEVSGKTFRPSSSRHWTTTKQGMSRLQGASRLQVKGSNVFYRRFLDDYPVTPITSTWDDTATGGYLKGESKLYVVQSNTLVVQRCILMTTDPGDLVMDPTCGSGTTAYVAEQWGRRWITIDTSRVAIALARQRVLTSKFDYYAKQIPDQPLQPGVNNFILGKVRHITLKSIAQNIALDSVFERWDQILAQRLQDLNNVLAKVSQEIRQVLQSKFTEREISAGDLGVTEEERRRLLLPIDAWQESEVPLQADPAWPKSLAEALRRFRDAFKAKMDEVNSTISASAPTEDSVDQPMIVRGIVRVSGPFTVEGLQPAEERLDIDSPIGDEPEELQTFSGPSPTDSKSQESLDASVEASNADAFLVNMIRLIAKDGVRFLNNQQVSFTRLYQYPNSVLHGAGEWQIGTAERRVAVAIGPQYGPITAKQVEDCLRAAHRGGFDDLIFAGFSFDAAAQAAIQQDSHPHVSSHLALISPDVIMGDLLKETQTSQLFTVIGLPRVEATVEKSGEWTVEMQGVDIYDPTMNSLLATKAEKVAAWFLDSNYDGSTFCITQAFFPDRQAWDKLAKALKTFVDPEKFEAFSGTRSLPFRAGNNRCAAVKVIDPRGNEVLRLISLDA